MKRTNRWIAFLAAAAILFLLPGMRSPAPAGFHAAARAESEGTVTGDYVNLRSGPSTAYARRTYLFRGDSVNVTGTSGNWYAVTHEGQAGYVYKSYVRVQTTSAGTDTGTSASATTLGYGSRGEAVRLLQSQLIRLGYLSGGADGIYGRLTQAAVRLYQQTNRLLVDGLAGKQTRSAVTAEVARINTVIDTAKTYLGLPYLYGGSSPETGFDCSGLTQYCFAAAGVTIPRVSYEQAADGLAVARSAIRPGDLVAFYSPVSHVGIYLGDGKFIHSPKTGDVVKITSLSAMNVTAVRRYTGRVV